MAATQLWLSLAFALLLAGCSAEAKKARTLKRADAYFAAFDYEKAKIEYTNVLRLGGDDPEAIERLGTIWKDEGAPLRALPFLIKTRDLAPGNLKNRETLARVFLDLGARGDARKEASAILEQSPKNGEALFLLAESTATKQEIAEAEERLKAFPERETASFFLASAALDFRKGDIAASKAGIEKAVVLDPKSVPAHLALGGLDLQQKDLAHAEPEFKTAADLAPIRSIARLKYAEFKAQSGAVDEAKVILKELTSQAPDYLPAWRALAQLSLTAKKSDEALTFLENIFRSDSMNLDGRLLQAQIWLAQGETKKAVEGLERLQATYPKLSTLKYQLARALLQENSLNRAMNSLKDVLETNPAYFEAALLLGELYLRSGDAPSAISIMSELLKSYPNLAPAQTLLAEGYRVSGQFDQALAVVRRQLENAPNTAQSHLMLGVILRQQGKTAEARESFEAAQRLAPNSPGSFLQLIDLDMAEKKYPEAYERVRLQLEKNPGSAPVYLTKGKIDVAQQKWDDAETAFTKALDLDPSSTAGYELLIATYMETNKVDQAVKQLNEFLAKDPTRPRALMTLAGIYERKNEFEKARDCYEKLVVTKPDFVPALNNLAYLYVDKFKQPGKAYELARKARNLQPNDPSVADTYGWVLYQRGSYAEALALFQDSVGKLAVSPEVQYHLGMAAYMMGRTDLARISLEKAVAGEENSSWKGEVRRRLTLLTSTNGTSDGLSLTELERVVKENPTDIVARMHLGAAYERIGAPEKAVAAYEGVVKLNAKLTPAVSKLAELCSGPVRNPAKALDFAKRARELAPDDPHIAAILGRALYQTGDFSRAHTFLLEATLQAKRDPGAFYDLAWAAYSLGKLAEARSAMQHVLELATDPSQAADATTFLAMLAIGENPKEVAASLPQIRKILEHDPHYTPALLAEGSFQLERGDTKTAAATFNSILSQLPDFAPAQKHLAAIYAQDPANQAKAFDLATKARRSMPDDADLAVTLAQIDLAKKDFAEVIRLLEQIAKKNALEAKGLFYLGISYSQTKQNDRARETLTQALNAGLQDPNATEAKSVLAHL